MEKSLEILLLTTLAVAFFHTLFGPDHYVPFAALAQARNWTKRKTAWITFFCGLGHVGSSVILGGLGILASVSVARLNFIEAVRGEVAAWLLIAFGITYFAWAMIQKFRSAEHHHSHHHAGAPLHAHGHSHHQEHMHPHEERERSNLAPWVLFIIFVFGPCEPLIPLVMYSALKLNAGAVIMVVSVFCVVTLLTMQAMVFMSLRGLGALQFRLERHAHALAGLSIFACGVLIKFFGL